eukprot:1795533-Rhodomonas_salina.4
MALAYYAVSGTGHRVAGQYCSACQYRTSHSTLAFRTIASQYSTALYASTGHRIGRSHHSVYITTGHRVGAQYQVRKPRSVLRTRCSLARGD